MSTETAPRVSPQATGDGAAQARRARFGRLPERTPLDRLVEGREATSVAAARAQDGSAWSVNHIACLAWDLAP